MVNDLSALHLLSSELDMYNSERILDQWNVVMQRLETTIHWFEKRNLNLSKINNELQLAILAFKECYRLRLTEMNDAQSGDYTEANHLALNHLTILLNNLTNMANSLAISGFTRIEEIRFSRNMGLAAIGSTGIVAIGILLFVVMNGIMRPLRAVLGGIKRVGYGDLNHRISPPTRSRNELYTLVTAFNGMVERLQTLVVSRQSTLDAAEQERARIGRELHDSVIQTLAGVRLQLENISGTEPQHLVIKRAREHLSIVQNEIQAIVKDLRPAMLDELGLLATLHWFKDQTQDTISINLFVDVEEGDIPIRLRTPIFRIIQEATSNALHHGKASTIHIQIHGEDDMLNLFLEDNGDGFDPAINPVGNGLVNMRERTEAEHGEMTIDSFPGRGCSIIISFPLTGDLNENSHS
jgi:signal transduction histidine kinase